MAVRWEKSVHVYVCMYIGFLQVGSIYRSKMGKTSTRLCMYVCMYVYRLSAGGLDLLG